MQEWLNNWWGALVPAVAVAVGSLLAGRTLRRILVLPLQWISGRTKTKIDDQLIQDVKHDWDLPEDK